MRLEFQVVHSILNANFAVCSKIDKVKLCTLSILLDFFKMILYNWIIEVFIWKTFKNLKLEGKSNLKQMLITMYIFRFLITAHSVPENLILIYLYCCTCNRFFVAHILYWYLVSWLVRLVSSTSVHYYMAWKIQKDDRHTSVICFVCKIQLVYFCFY